MEQKSMKEKILEEGSKYLSEEDFKKGNHRFYLFAQNRGLLSKLFPMHTVPLPPDWGKRVAMKRRLDNLNKGVYFLLSDSVIVYIGKSVNNVYGRLMAHKQDKVFDEIHHYHIPNEADIHIMEMYLIAIHKPKYNRDGISDDTTTIVIKNLSDILPAPKIIKDI